MSVKRMLSYIKQDLVALIDQALFSLAGFVQVFAIVHLFGVDVLGQFSAVWYAAVLLETILNASVVQGAVVNEVSSKKFGGKDLFGIYLLLAAPLSFGLAMPVSAIVFESPSIREIVLTFLFLMVYHLPSFTRKLIYLFSLGEAEALLITSIFIWGRVFVLFGLPILMPSASLADLLWSLAVVSGSVVFFASSRLLVPNLVDCKRLAGVVPEFFKDARSFSLVSQGISEWICFMGPAYAISYFYGPVAAGVYVSSRTLGTSLNLLAELFSVSKLRESINLRGESFGVFIYKFRFLLSACALGAILLLILVSAFGDSFAVIFYGGTSYEYSSFFLMMGVIIQCCYLAFMIAKMYLRINGSETTNTIFSLLMPIVFGTGFLFDLSFSEYYLYYTTAFFIFVFVIWFSNSLRGRDFCQF